MPDISASSWSETDASNNAAPPSGWPENQAMSTVNDCGRMVMGAIKRAWNRLNPTVASTGSANAYVLTPAVPLAAYVTGEIYSFRASFTNTGSATLAISGQPAVILKRFTSGIKTNLQGGELAAGFPVQAVYDGTDMVIMTASAQGAGPLIGSVVAFAGATIPAGWLACYGQAVSRTTYATLFTVLGTTYGTGDGSTTFNLPDCRGRVLAGKDDMGGASANRLTTPNGDVLGAAGGTQALASHTHTFSDTATTSTPTGTQSNVGNQGTAITITSTSHTHTVSVSGTTAAPAAALDIIQPTIVLNTIIYAGV